METNVERISQDGLEISCTAGSKWRIIGTGDISKTIIGSV